MNVVPCAHNADEYSKHNERRAKPERHPGRLHLVIRADLQRLQEQTEARHDETEAHKRQTCSNPREKGSFRRKIVAGAAHGSVCHKVIPSVCQAGGPPGLPPAAPKAHTTSRDLKIEF
jgi:hypothetical protein